MEKPVLSWTRSAGVGRREGAGEDEHGERFGEEAAHGFLVKATICAAGLPASDGVRFGGEGVGVVRGGSF